MTEIEAAQILKRIREEIARLEADIADWAFLTAEDLNHACGALSGLRTALWLSEMWPENENGGDITDQMRSIMGDARRCPERPEELVW